MGTRAATKKGTRGGHREQGAWGVVEGNAGGGPRPPEGGRGERMCVHWHAVRSAIGTLLVRLDGEQFVQACA